MYVCTFMNMFMNLSNACNLDWQLFSTASGSKSWAERWY